MIEIDAEARILYLELNNKHGYPVIYYGQVDKETNLPYGLGI